jgi:Transposase DDE domain
MERTLHMLMAFTYLPGFVTIVFRGMPTVWRGRHRLIFCWLVFMQAVHPGRKTLAEMARWTPAAITAWRFGRLLKATYWNVHLLVSWLAQDLVATLPPPPNGILHLFGDGSHADKRGTKNPVGQKGRISQHHPWFFGIRFVVLMAAWDGYRIPVSFRLILPKGHAEYRSENALFREMVGEFVPPRWAKLVIVGGDAAYGSKANMAMVKARDKADTARRWGFVFAIARTWKTVEEKSIKELVTHVPYKYYQCTRVPREPGRKGRKTFWTYSTCLCLRHVGDVTVVLSKQGRNRGPQQTKILVTNLAELTPSQVVCIYRKRWAIELLNWELKSGLGLGEHQVSGNKERSEKSVGIAVLAYLFVLRICHHEIVPGKPWSIFQLQHTLRLRVMTNQVEHKVKVKMAKTCKAA